MITIINQKGTNTFHPVSNPINITVNSNNSGKCSFMYVCDIKINGTSVFKDKLFPDPATGYGFFQLNQIISDYIENMVPKTPTNNNAIFDVASGTTIPNSVVKVRCSFGEQYDPSTTCTGSILQYYNLITSNEFIVFNGAIDYESFLSFDYTDYLGVWASASNNMSFLTNSPREVDVTYNETYQLEYLSLSIPTSQSPTNYTDGYVGLAIQRNYVDGTTHTSVVGYPQGRTVNPIRYRLMVGPLDINRYYQTSFIDPKVKSYSVRLVWFINPNPMVDVPIDIIHNLSETFNFKVYNPKPFQTRLGFLGRLGSMEGFTFYHRNTSSYDIQRSTYRKLLQSNYSGSLTYQVGDRSDSTFNIRAKETHKVGTFCSKPISNWLYEMWLSPDVWLSDLPELQEFSTYTDGITIYLVAKSDDHGIKANDSIFVFASYNPNNGVLIQPALKAVYSVSGRLINIGLAYDITYSTEYCGWFQKNDNWRRLPVMISDQSIEVKQKLTRPIEYNLNYSSAYDKYTIR